MQGAEMEDEGSVLKYMTKSEIEERRCSLLIMTQRLFLSARIVFLTENNQQNTVFGQEDFLIGRYGRTAASLIMRTCNWTLPMN